MRILKSFAVALAATFAAPAAEALTFDIVETGSGVTLTASGALDTTGLNFAFVVGPSSAFTNAQKPQLQLGLGNGDNYTGVFTALGSPFGTSGFRFAGFDTGDAVGFDASSSNRLILPVGYQSGDPISASAVFAGETFASLGILAGAYTYDLTNGESVTLTATPIPLPAALPLALAGVGALLAAGRRRSRA